MPPNSFPAPRFAPSRFQTEFAQENQHRHMLVVSSCKDRAISLNAYAFWTPQPKRIIPKRTTCLLFDPQSNLPIRLFLLDLSRAVHPQPLLRGPERILQILRLRLFRTLLRLLHRLSEHGFPIHQVVTHRIAPCRSDA